MKKTVQTLISFIFLSAFLAVTSASVLAVPKSSFVENLLVEWGKTAKSENSSFNGFNADKGKAFFNEKRMHTKKNELRACTSCHSIDLATMGQTPVGKPIDPLSPAVTTNRFQDLEKIEKWFGRNCKWVLQRPCTSEEKGNFFTYFFSL